VSLLSDQKQGLIQKRPEFNESLDPNKKLVNKVSESLKCEKTLRDKSNQIKNTIIP